MREIRRMIVLLDIPHSFQGLLRRELFVRQDSGYQEHRLPEGQGWRPFFRRLRVRTRK